MIEIEQTGRIHNPLKSDIFSCFTRKSGAIRDKKMWPGIINRHIIAGIIFTNVGSSIRNVFADNTDRQTAYAFEVESLSP